MFKKLVCSILALGVFFLTMPTQAYAGKFQNGSDEIPPIGEIHPIMDAVDYLPPVPGRDELAYLAFTDQLGRLFDVDVNVTRKTAAVRSAQQQFPPIVLTDLQAALVGDLARTIASSPEDRIQVCVDLATCLAVGAIIVAAIGAIITHTGLVMDGLRDQFSCDSRYLEGARSFINERNRCTTEAKSTTCPNGRQAVPNWQTSDWGNVDTCSPPMGYCGPPQCN